MNNSKDDLGNKVNSDLIDNTLLQNNLDTVLDIDNDIFNLSTNTSSVKAIPLDNSLVNIVRELVKDIEIDFNSNIG